MPNIRNVIYTVYIQQVKFFPDPRIQYDVKARNYFAYYGRQSIYSKDIYFTDNIFDETGIYFNILGKKQWIVSRR